MEEEKKDPPQIRRPAQNGVNGNGVHFNNCDTDSESDAEEPEPVSATLVLRVVSEPPSPALSRHNSFRKDQPPSFLNEDSRGDTFLQVQVQRSTSSNSLPRSRHQSHSRPVSATPSCYVTDTEPVHDTFQLDRTKRRSQMSSMDTSRASSISPSSSMYGLSEIDLHRPNGVNTVNFMEKVKDQTKVIQQGLKTLRGEVDNPLRVLDIGQEAIVLSGLNKQAGESLKNIKNLYDETKYLKNYLEKLEAKVHYDIALKRKTAYRPPWYRRLLFVAVLVCAGGVTWRRLDSTGFDRNISLLAAAGISAYSVILDFFTDGGTRQPGIVTLQ